ncbi:rRNA maturation RNase YbeY [Altibacter sp.]|uniref:rRNA maturation RNase YbeY n=1 Tax=Altibacter sp. TaxID=2024823 RepID=UPI000C8A06C7|nr:rRNA maturation RNase YbeY [Altibacter sp.]MAP55669.1 rRNA maturation RNase YbeY [Altibacter sp.]|tara:strand:- start:1070 stop:1486 length:417 start_codon:yes stop_codon:yes gene_type:complete
MIDFFSETDFNIAQSKEVQQWISQEIISEGCEEGDISFVFCDDAFLLSLNLEYLDHDTLTDIISFDYSLGKQLHGEIYISIERVKENAILYSDSFEDELHRVMIHGILHFCGYKDKTKQQQHEMRSRETKALASRTFL